MAYFSTSDVSISLPGPDRHIAHGRKTLSLPDISFGNGALEYATGGVPLPAIGHFGLKKAIQRLLIQQPHANGYLYKYDPANHKIKILAAAERADTGDVVTVTHAATPGGNPVYLKYTAAGVPYLCSNMATAAADKVLTLGAHKVVIKHDASASGGLQVFFDEDGAAGAQLLVNNTITGVAAFVPTTTPGYAVKVNHDGSASANGVALNYDDGADDRLEATFAGAANVDLSLSAYAAGELAEIADGSTPAAVTLPAIVIGE